MVPRPRSKIKQQFHRHHINEVLQHRARVFVVVAVVVVISATKLPPIITDRTEAYLLWEENLLQSGARMEGEGVAESNLR